MLSYSSDFRRSLSHFLFRFRIKIKVAGLLTYLEPYCGNFDVCKPYFMEKKNTYIILVYGIRIGLPKYCIVHEFIFLDITIQDF